MGKFNLLIGSVVGGLLSLTFPVQASPKLRVGVYVNPPYVIENQVLSVNDSPLSSSQPSPSSTSANSQSKAITKFSGISIEIWQKMANLNNLDYNYYVVKKIDTGINEVANGNLDLLVGSISVTPERLRKVTFTQPYYTSYPALLVPSHSPTLGQLIRPFLQRAVIFAVVGLVFLLFLVANLVWLIEHKHNPQFPKKYSKGVREAFWFISVTTTTVGYGDKFPITENGRLVTNIWMWLSLALTVE
jgi:polar amino acid transport system substrate-binding protein